MVTGSKIPFISENKKMKDALKVITTKTWCSNSKR